MSAFRFPVSPTILLVIVFLALGAPAPAARAENDPRAVEVAERLMEGMGGKENWDTQRLIAFRFVVERDGEELSNWLHIWDRYSGRYRLEGETRDGQFLRVLFNVNSREGEAWLGADKLEPEAAAPYIEQAYGRFINDTYWLLMPWKWLDPGVILTYEGETDVDGVIHDVVHLGFDAGVGLTSNDQYWGYVSRETHLMTRWEFLLQDREGNPGTGDRSRYAWEEWETVGESGIKLSTRKTRMADGPPVAIRYPVLQLSAETNPDLFDPPPPPAAAPPAEPSGTPPAEAGLEEVLVILNKSDHTAALVDPGSLEVLRTVPTGLGPHEAAVSHDGRTLYVANYGTNSPGNSLSVIDVPSGEVLRVVDLGDNGRPHGIAVDPAGDVWVTTEESKCLLRLAGDDLSLRNRYATDQEITHMVVLTPDGQRAFTANIGSGSVSVVDADGTVRNVDTGQGAEGIDISPDGEEVWVAHRNDNNLVVLDAVSLEKLATLETGEFPIRVRMTPDGNRVLVSCAASNELVIYDRAGRKETGRVPLEDTPVGILVSPDGLRAFVANTGSDKVSVVDLRTLEVVSAIEPGREPDGLAWASW